MRRGLARLYALLTGVVVERWIGSLHAGAVVRGLYLRWTLARRLRRGRGMALDAGCGEHAQFTRLFARRFPAWRFVGVDLKIVGGKSQLPNVMLVRGDLRAMPVVGSFDVIYSVDVLEHLEDVEGCLRGLVERLSPAGWLFLHVPAVHQRRFLRRVDLESSWLEAGAPGEAHLWPGFAREQLESWLEKAGCHVLHCRFTFGSVVTILKELFMLGEARRIPGVGLCLLPFIVLAAWCERCLGGRSGNGLLLLATRGDVRAVGSACSSVVAGPAPVGFLRDRKGGGA